MSRVPTPSVEAAPAVLDGSPSSDIAFSPSVKAEQARHGSRPVYAKLEARGGFRIPITSELVAFLAEVDTAFVATASAEGQPYAQHRGGPKGFIRAIDEHTLGFADYAGNRQYITAGNLRENDRVLLFLMDYAQRRRVKLWGRARILDGDSELLAKLMPAGYDARPERAILIRVLAWDLNCPRHIPQKLDAEDVALLLGPLQMRVAELEAENARLRRAAARDRDGGA